MAAIDRKSRTPLALAWRRLKNLFHPDVTITKAPPGLHADWDVPVAMRDGVTLRVNVFRPEGEGRWPVIMSAHPYGKDRIAAQSRSGRRLDFQYRLCPQPDPISFSDLTSWEAPDPAVWVPRGYCVINADLRGCGTSGGVGDPFTALEANDYCDLINWAGTQPWSSGRVGLDGVSYLAISQYEGAAVKPAHLAAICPWEGFSDLYRDFFRPGGIREDGFSIIWSRGMSRRRIRTNLRSEVVKHTERDAWWQERTPSLESIDVPMLVCGSFSDHSLHTRGSFEVFRRAGSSRKWLYTHRSGKWSTYYGNDATEARIGFFDHVLKGLDNGWAERPAVRLAIHDIGSDPVAVTGEESWPPSDLDWRPLWLDARSGSLASTQPDAEASVAFDLPDGCCSYLWTVPEDLDLIGPMALRLHLELRRGDDAFLFAGVRKLRGGVETRFEGSMGFSGDMVSKGWQRLAHRDLDGELSTEMQPVHMHDHAGPLRPGEIRPVTIALLPHATRFLKGDQLQIDIRGRWHYPRDPLRGQFPIFYQPSPSARCVMHTGGIHDAHLLVGTRQIAATAEKAQG
ncbi:CocE/NonD family hydrolase [Rhizobium sp. A37_96]